MIICPSCAHSNPDGATNCEACFTPLPVVVMINCSNCGASVQSDASFCGHCGFDLKSTKAAEVAVSVAPETAVPQPVAAASTSSPVAPDPSPVAPPLTSPDDLTEISTVPPPVIAAVAAQSVGTSAKTQLQTIRASLLHIQTNITLELPAHLPVIHLGKPNNVIPPDIDVSGFPDSDVVSRVHADIRFEGDAFYFEDTGSSNGSYINNTALPAGNRHRLRAGDRIALGKGDKVSFIFQTT
ncbi:FHA domain-containing protein [Tumidithrix helvetica PCC 7403]|uniref:FHA domain-containing protein n=1 Tax=Tumidithrix helvetica TaxID=3457545 RepID=UPI003C9A7015